MKKLILLLIPTLLFSCAEKSNTGLTAEQKKQLYEEIQPVIAQIHDAAAKADSMQMMDAYSATEDFRYVGISGEFLDHAAFKEMVSRFYGTITGEMLEKGTEKYTYIDENSVLWTSTGAVTVTYKNGWKLTYKPFVATFLFRKTDGKWKAVFLQESGKEASPTDTANHR